MCLAGCTLCFELSPEIQPGIGLAPVSLSTFPSLSVYPPFSTLSCISFPIQHHFLCTNPPVTPISLWSSKAFCRDFGKESSRHGLEPHENRRQGSRMSLSQFQKGNKLRDIIFQRQHSPFCSPTLSFLLRL